MTALRMTVEVDPVERPWRPRSKQQLPKLQAGLQKKGWQVETVRLKIQIGRALAERAKVEAASLDLPPTAVDAFEQLGDTLPGDGAERAPDCGDQKAGGDSASARARATG